MIILLFSPNFCARYSYSKLDYLFIKTKLFLLCVKDLVTDYARFERVDEGIEWQVNFGYRKFHTFLIRIKKAPETAIFSILNS